MTNKTDIEKILGCYIETQNAVEYAPFGNGHINDTYLVKNSANKQYVLQRVNKNVFRINALEHNYKHIAAFIDGYQKNTGTKLTPNILETKQGEIHIIDKEGYAWRLAEFIPNAKSYAISPNIDVSFRAAKAMGAFQGFLNTLQSHNFDYTIINFHNPEKRLENFEKAINKADSKQLGTSEKEIAFCKENQGIVAEYNNIVSKLPRRITHNDTKLDNMLFYDKGVLVIDLDTIMPSSLLFDYGDMVRSFSSPAAEDEQDENKTKFRTEHFEALTKGYLEGLSGDIKEIEKNNLLLGARTIIYEQSLRFLTDYLSGNIYYKIKYPEHNLVRTRTQVKLLSEIETNKEKLQHYISSL